MDYPNEKVLHSIAGLIKTDDIAKWLSTGPLSSLQLNYSPPPCRIKLH